MQIGLIAPTAQPDVSAPPPTTTYTNNYTPQTYAPPAPTYSSHGSYDPSTSYYAAESKPQPPPNTYSRSISSTVNPAYSSATTVPAPPPPTISTISRPKVSNAYDPPFLPNKPARRPGRTSAAQQAYNAYQTPLSPPSHAQPIQPPSNLSPSYFPPNGPAQNEYQQVSPQVSPAAQYNQAAPTAHPSSPASSYYTNEYTPAQPSTGLPPPPPRAPSYSPEAERFKHPMAPVANENVARSFHSNGSNGMHPPQRYPTPPQRGFTPRSERSGSIGSTSSIPRDVLEHSPIVEAVPPAVTSPSMVPLPYSPPVPKVDLHLSEVTPLSIAETGTKSPPAPSSAQTSPYASYQPPPKKEAAPPKEVVYDPYAPKSNHATGNYIPRTSSPLSVYNGRPSEQSKKVPQNPPSNVNGATSNYNALPRTMSMPYPPKPRLNGAIDETSPRHGHGPVQELIVKASIGQYAPSPSLLGANDPLSRTSARAPVITFGFGGKMITCFHGMPGLNTGFDVALSSRTTSELKVRVLHKFLPESTLESPGSAYPGPLVSDAASTSLSLVRPGAANQTKTKTKKSGVVAYLAARAEEIYHGLGYLAPAEKQIAESKLILVKLLKILVENDGRLLGTCVKSSFC